MYTSSFNLSQVINNTNTNVVLLTTIVQRSDFSDGYIWKDNLLSLLKTTYDDLSWSYKAIVDKRPFARTLYDDTTHLFQYYSDYIGYLSDLYVIGDANGTTAIAIRGLLDIIRNYINDIRSRVVMEFM
jgi:hypothetical protein